MSQPSVRRNLFQQTLSRRPATTTPLPLSPPPPPPHLHPHPHSHPPSQSHLHPHAHHYSSIPPFPSLPPHPNTTTMPMPLPSNDHTSNNNTTTTGTTNNHAPLSNRSALHRLKPASHSRPHSHLSSATDPSRTMRYHIPEKDREIVVRDKHGGYKLDMPSLPPQTSFSEDGEELGDVDVDVGVDGGSGMRNALEAELSGKDKEKFEAALVEMVIRHRNRQTSGGPDEILDIVHQNLRKQVASLDDDNWMFEPEREIQP
ncbi:hypothetical protein N7539_003188 [Penicillium diatomitis]|uniref:Uncharacterized protein n=1 Tax=Penicillium diatomitis TaxID=2819901 RepID=A0A9X0BZE9_9EURO|nr:uncharacterized protein N7539_003188 [Penicillium diatomitis]KAJ5491621.1 hypothetical protein N7539_003188 [Penicillium diatomitis]